MQKDKICFIGVDLAPPKNEMLSKIVDELTYRMKKDSYVKLSVQKKKRDPEDNNTITIKQFPILSKAVQGILLFLKFLTLNRKDVTTVNIIWSGFGVVDDLLIYTSKMLGYKVVYIVTTTRQSQKRSLKRCDKVIFFNLDHKDSLEKICDTAALTYLLPAHKPSDQLKKSPLSGDLLFVTTPFRKEDLQKRGVDLLLDLMKEIEKSDKDMQLTLLNRWIEGESVIKDMMAERSVKNCILVSETVDQMDSVYKNHKCLINLDHNSGAPTTPMSIIEALSNGTPVCTTQQSWLSDQIENSGAGKISTSKISELRSSILTILENYSEYSDNAMKLSTKINRPEEFTKEYINVLLSL